LGLGDGVCREGKDGLGDGGICNVPGSGEMGGGDGVTGEEPSVVVSGGGEEDDEDVPGDCGHGDLIFSGVNFLLKNSISIT